ncbi:MAG: phosphatidate cytidylyltransferase [Saprospiraceae bacterium]
MRQRTITAVFFAFAMLGGIYGGYFYGGRYPFYCLSVIIAAGCLWELMDLLFPQEETKRNFRKLTGTLMGVAPVMWFGKKVFCYSNCGLSTIEEIGEGFRMAHFDATVEIAIFVVLATFLLFSVELFLSGKSPFTYIGHYLTGLFYVGIPICLLFSIASTPDGSYYPNRVLGLLLLVWTNDSGAYLTGKNFGKHKLFKRISPNKTWEGTLGGATLTVLMAWGLSLLIKDFTLLQWLALSIVAAIGSNLGDLIESMLKRSVGVKDSGTFMPGHGGFLDRFDAFIFCLPFYWLVLLMI